MGAKMINLEDSNSLFDIYKSLFENNCDACYALDLNGYFKLFNDAATKITGYTFEEIKKMTFTTLFQENELDKVIAMFHRALKGSQENFETIIINKYGEKVYISVTEIPIINKHQQIIGTIGIAKDITEKKKTEILLSEQNRVLEMIAKGFPFLEVLENIILLVENNSSGKCSILLVDEKVEKLYNRSSPNIPKEYVQFIDGIPMGPNIGSCGTATYYKKPIIATNIETDSRWTDFKDVALAHNSKACCSSPILDNNKNVLGTFAMYYDKTTGLNATDIQIIEAATYLASLTIQHYYAEAKINFMAYHDELTQLPNRRLFQTKVQEAIEKYDKEAQSLLAFLYLDLDRFKLINDTLGHTIGDKLLNSVSNRIRECIRQMDIASRQGGDEFTILLDSVSKNVTKEVAQGIIDILEEPFMIDNHEIFITPSIGISFYPLDGENADELLRKADIAMYQAKKEGRNNFQFYDDILINKSSDQLELENELRKALDLGQFSIHFQPIVDIKTKTLSSAEALIRWSHPRLGNVSPSIFIPIAEETGLIVSIGEWILRETCLQMKKWESDSLQLATSINLSIRQFFQPNLIEMIERILKETGINPNLLTFEITESMTMDVEKTISILLSLQNLGVNISIDDFGTGYSSLSYLKKLPLDYLKIDQSFISDISICNTNESIASTIISLAHNLGLKVIAEGVETEDQLQFLLEHHCNEAQGYYFCKPLPMEELKNYLVHSLY